MQRYGRKWTKVGTYNWVRYKRGDKIHALPGSPTAQTDYIVCWFPGRPTVGVVARDEEDALCIAEQIHQSIYAVMQEPIENGAWRVKLRSDDRWAGPYSLNQIMGFEGPRKISLI